jgi:dolichol-phosphate mannosyltransferase
MPLEVWVQIAAAGLPVVELPVPLIYLDDKRSFGGALDDADTRLDYYYRVVERSMARIHAAQIGPRPPLHAQPTFCRTLCRE